MKNPAPELLKGESIYRIAKVLHVDGYKTKEIERKLEEFVIRCSPRESLAAWRALIEKCVASSKGRAIIELDSIKVTKAEMATVRRVESIQGRRILFTLICLCRIQNYARGNASDWVNVESSNLFSRANVTLGRERGQALIRSLWQDGYIGYSKVIDNLNLKVQVMAEEDEAVMEVTSFKNLGNQYMLYEGEPFIACQGCGTVVRKSSNAQKYCKACSDEIRRAKKNEENSKALLTA